MICVSIDRHCSILFVKAVKMPSWPQVQPPVVVPCAIATTAVETFQVQTEMQPMKACALPFSGL